MLTKFHLRKSFPVTCKNPYKIISKLVIEKEVVNDFCKALNGELMSTSTTRLKVKYAKKPLPRPYDPIKERSKLDGPKATETRKVSKNRSRMLSREFIPNLRDRTRLKTYGRQ